VAKDERVESKETYERRLIKMRNRCLCYLYFVFLMKIFDDVKRDMEFLFTS